MAKKDYYLIPLEVTASMVDSIIDAGLERNDYHEAQDCLSEHLHDLICDWCHVHGEDFLKKIYKDRRSDHELRHES